MKEEIQPSPWVNKHQYQWEGDLFTLISDVSDKYGQLMERKKEVKLAIQIELSDTETEVETAGYNTIDWLFSDACQLRVVKIPVFPKNGIAKKYPTIRKELVRQYFDTNKKKDLIGKWGRYFYSRLKVIKEQSPWILKKFDGYTLWIGYHPESEVFIFQHVCKE